MRSYPCVLLEPAFSLVQDHMTLYGTCDYRKMFRLKLKLSGGQWIAQVKRSEMNCMDEEIKEFVMTWRGQNHTVNSGSFQKFTSSIGIKTII